MTVGPPDDVPFPSYNGERHDIVTDLAAELAALRAKFERAETDLAELRADRDHDRERIAALSGLGGAVTRLSTRVEHAASVLPAMSARAAQDDEDAEPDVFAWVAADPLERVARLDELHLWVTEVLRTRYPKRSAPLLDCWPLHPTVVEELNWCYGDWLDIYASVHGTYRSAGDWHDRQLAGVLHRITQDAEFDDCDNGHPGAGPRPPLEAAQRPQRFQAVREMYHALGADLDRRYMATDQAESVAAELLPAAGLDWDDETSQIIPALIHRQKLRAALWQLYAEGGRTGDARYLDRDAVDQLAATLGPRIGLTVDEARADLHEYINQRPDQQKSTV